MKIIGTDNFDRENVADWLVADNIKSEREGKVMLEALQSTCSSHGAAWYKLVEDDYRLSRGMADIVGEPEELEAEAALAKCSKNAQSLMKRLLEHQFHLYVGSKKLPKCLDELIRAGLVVEGGRIAVAHRCYVPYGTTSFVTEEFPKHARRSPRHEEESGTGG